jgi:hypothetical protein
MGDLTNPRLMYLKGFLLLLAGGMASALLLFECPSWSTALLHLLAIGCFCRAYYFAFYVIQHYIDPTYRFAGLSSFLLYLWRRRKGDGEGSPPS